MRLATVLPVVAQEARPSRTIHLFFASALTTAVVLSGIYAIAAAAATTLAASITTEETARHSRSVAFTDKTRLASAEARQLASEKAALGNTKPLP